MMHLKSEEIEVLRDCPAVTIPYGSPVTIEKGCTAVITQQLGSSVTVMVQGNLYRVEAQDVDALGLEVQAEERLKPDGPVTEEFVRQTTWDVLSSCYDPEIPVDIVNLGLVYGCDIIPLGDEKFRVEIRMTLTAPGCGMGTMIADEARSKVLNIHGVEEVTVDLVWDPPWSREMMSESARLQLGML